MKNITVEQYRDLIDNLYDLTPDEKQIFVDRKQDFEAKLKGYSYDEIKSVVEEYCLETKGRTTPRLSYITLVAEHNRPFKNPMPLDDSFYKSFDSIQDLVEKLKPNAQAWIKENKQVASKFNYLQNKLSGPKTQSELNDCEAERKKTVRELAKTIWEYKDTIFVQNSPVDPKFWCLNRFLVSEDSQDLFLALGATLGNMYADQ